MLILEYIKNRNLMKISAAVLGITLLILGGCSLQGGGSGVLELSISDAPVNDKNITGVYITIEEVRIQTEDDGWHSMTEFESPQTFNLLELTGGESALLGSVTLPAGEYQQIRFILAAPEEGAQLSGGNPGSWVNYDDNAEFDENSMDIPLFIPSGAQSGYKAVAQQPFVVPINGTVSITTEFLVRQALVDTNNGMILKPVQRIIVNDQAGAISGNVTYSGGGTEPASMVVFAYENGAFSSSEPDNGDNGFDGSVTSVAVGDDGSYTLAFLNEGEYDLVVAQYDSDGNYFDGSGESVDKDNVSVSSGETTENINFEEDE